MRPAGKGCGKSTITSSTGPYSEITKVVLLDSDSNVFTELLHRYFYGLELFKNDDNELFAKLQKDSYLFCDVVFDWYEVIPAYLQAALIAVGLRAYILFKKLEIFSGEVVDTFTTTMLYERT